MNHYKIPTAPFAVIHMLEGAADLTELQAASLPYPLFIKPVTEGSSKGIESRNKLDSRMELGPALKELGRGFPDQDIVVEPFLSGREFTVSILGTGSRSRVIGIREHIWKLGRHSSESDCHQQSPPEFASRLSKSSQGGKVLTYEDSHDMAEPQIKACCQTALKTWKAFNCQDCGRVDIRFDTEKPSSIPCVLEVCCYSHTSNARKQRTHIFIVYTIGESNCRSPTRSFAFTSDGRDKWPFVPEAHF